MLPLRALAARNDSQARLADPDAAEAYRSLERVLSIGCEPQAPGDVPPLVRAVLRTYARALDNPRTQRGPIAWATFVRAATLLYFAFDLHCERYADPRWRRAALTLQQIALENADLIVRSPLVEAS
jgi:hypothetical protein